MLLPLSPFSHPRDEGVDLISTQSLGVLIDGRHPFALSYGAEITFPAPATQDGILPDPAGGERQGAQLRFAGGLI